MKPTQKQELKMASKVIKKVQAQNMKKEKQIIEHEMAHSNKK